ncbi:MAG: hypothetical protein ACOZIN_15245 [Myxococcota bacterium]
MGAPHPDPLPKGEGEWRAAVNAVKAVSARHGKSLGFGRLVKLEPGAVTLAFPRDAAFHRATVTGTARPLVEKALSDHFRCPTRIIEAPADTPAPSSLAEEEARAKAVREKDLEGKVRAHPAVQATLRRLGGEIEFVRVLEEEQPVDGGEAPPPEEG